MTARVHPTALVDPSADLDLDVVIEPFAVIGPGVRVGAGTTIGTRATVYGPTSVGAGCSVGIGAVLGTDPQDLKYAGEDTELVIGDDTHVREYVTVNRGTAASGSTPHGNGYHEDPRSPSTSLPDAARGPHYRFRAWQAHRWD